MSLRHFPALLLVVFVAACESGTSPDNTSGTLITAPSASRNTNAAASVSVFATGLQFPRGLTFGPNGDLYVAEAGAGGTTSTIGQCTQVIPPVGPYRNGPTARISRIDHRGQRTTFATGFPSGINSFGDVLGIGDVAFIGNELFALVAGGGCSHGSATVPAEIARVSRSGSWSKTADLSAWQAAHPVEHPNAGDFEPDGSWYGMISSEGSLVAVEPNHGEVVRVNPRNGHVTRIADISATQGHIVPTVVAERRGALYLSSLGVFPGTPGSQKIFRISRSGALSEVASGFTAVLGLDFDARGRLYVLETGEAGGFPAPGAGRVIRLDRKGNRVVIVDGLFLPTGLRIGPDGRLYISNKGYGPPQPGEILRVDIRSSNGRNDEDDDMESDR
ncbi:MAG TPA: ScyD/ScyE family protein [Gemmatimonadaceae bacterium]|nr:ScyD/ScyE family protein [Gemmatimonadaceae bacterium]